MAAPVPLRPDFDAPRLRAFARRSRDPDQTRRLMALAAIYAARLEAIAEEAGRKPVEIWFGDEARIGQKNKITRRWARRGTRPQRPRPAHASAYIFGAICPAKARAPVSSCPAAPPRP